MPRKSTALIKTADIRTNIHEVRGQRVILDSDLAKFYGVETRALNQAVKRNPDKFPPDFVFPLKYQEVKGLISQPVISKDGRGGRRKTTYAFTEHGALMAANVLRSPKANQMSVMITRAFVELRNEGRKQLEHILDTLAQHDAEIAGICAMLKEVLEMKETEKKLLH